MRQESSSGIAADNRMFRPRRRFSGIATLGCATTIAVTDGFRPRRRFSGIATPKPRSPYSFRPRRRFSGIATSTRAIEVQPLHGVSTPKEVFRYCDTVVPSIFRPRRRFSGIATGIITLGRSASGRFRPRRRFSGIATVTDGCLKRGTASFDPEGGFQVLRLDLGKKSQGGPAEFRPRRRFSGIATGYG